jgi:leucyl aminopeptidase
MAANDRFNPTPSRSHSSRVKVEIASSPPPRATALGVAVSEEGAVPRQVGLSRSKLTADGFEGKIGQALAVPQRTGPNVFAVGIGKHSELDAAKLRDAAAAFGRAAAKHTRLATTLAADSGIRPEMAAQTVVEGVLLARYRYDPLKREAAGTPVSELTVVVPGASAATQRGADRGRITAAATQLARDLSNTPPAYLTATRMADVATEIASASGLDIEVFDKDALIEMGCGGLLGVNAGSTEPPRMIKLTYTPKDARGRRARASGHLALVGKGIMYDSGGISLKPSDAMHAAMKMDMSGAAAVLSAMSALSTLQCKTAVTGYLMCTDNMPSGSATKLGDVLTIRGGTTVEVRNTDAEGRLVMADALVLAAEEKPDAIADIATLTGACMRALGTAMSGVMGNNQAFVDQVLASGNSTDESTWQLPLDKRYRKQMDSDIADLNNIGGDGPGAITAALFLAEFGGDIPWAHIDIAGPMKSDADESWRSKGATGFGARLLIDLALNFAPAKR